MSPAMKGCNNLLSLVLKCEASLVCRDKEIITATTEKKGYPLFTSV